MLDQLTREVKRELETACVLAPNARPPPLPHGTMSASWISRERLGSRLGLRLRASQYRSVTSRLSLLLRYQDLAVKYFQNSSPFAARGSAHQQELVQQIIEILESFTNELTLDPHHDASSASDALSGMPTHGMIDDLGRAYARGRRKVSSARVWLVRAKPTSDGQIPTGEILINNAPLSQYFLRTAHREIVTWPFRLAGVLGVYNVFALVRGGGASGQAGALAHGIANALVAALGSAEGEHATQVQSHIQQLLARGTSSFLFVFFVVVFFPLSPHYVIFQTNQARRCSHSRPTHGGTKEAWSCQGTQSLHMGQALKIYSIA